jgi:MFS family permease
MAPVPAAAANPSGSSSLWRHPDFLRLWVGQTVSQFGSTISREALPLTALLVLQATPLQMGVLAASAAVPALVGVWVDRLGRRPLMLLADFGRAALLASIAVAAFVATLRLDHVLIVWPRWPAC